MQMRRDFEDLKAEVKRELVGKPTMMNTIQSSDGQLGFQVTGSQQDGLRDVEMMDIAELERERDKNDGAGGAGARRDEEDEELARVRL